MTILQVCAYAAPYEGNFITSLKALAKKLKEKGHTMIYAFPETAQEKDWCKALAETTKVYFLPLAKARIKPATYNRLKKIYKENPDIGIIHCHFELYDIPVVITAKKNMKVFWHLHDAIGNIQDSHNQRMYKIQYKMLHKKAILLSVSEKHMDYTIDLGFPKEQAYYVPNGLNTEAIKLVETEYTLRKNDFLLYGWEYERKGVDLCAKAQNFLSSQFYVCIIGNKDTAARVESEFGTIKNLEIGKPVADANLLYKNTKAFLHISRAEGLSYALLEAIYAGLPIVCSNIKENMFAEEFPTVHMVKSENVESIANGMAYIMEKGQPTKEEITVARKIIDEKYSIACWTDTILRYYGIE